MAVNREVLQPFSDHLTFFGYEVRFDEIGLAATHSLKPSFRVYTLPEGVIFLAPYAIGQAITNDMTGFMDFLNRVNAGTGLCKYYLSFGKFFVQACYPAEYERQRFGRFFEAFLNGIGAPSAMFTAEV